MTAVNKLIGEGQEIWSVTPTDTVYAAVEKMAEKGIGALVVLDGGKLVGMVSERDYARKVILAGKASKTTRVADIMTANVVYVEPQATVQECMALMTDKHVRHLPVMENGELLGLVSIGDLVKAIIAEQQFMIEELQHYING